ncbi:hypothetical protein MXB_5150, partial [Myxobolus squamalis]
ELWIELAVNIFKWIVWLILNYISTYKLVPKISRVELKLLHPGFLEVLVESLFNSCGNFFFPRFFSMSLYVPPALHAQSGFLEFATWPASFAIPAYIETDTPLATCLEVITHRIQRLS